MMAVANKLVAQSDAQGALPTLYAATQDVPGASYVGPDGFQEARGHPTLVVGARPPPTPTWRRSCGRRPSG